MPSETPPASPQPTPSPAPPPPAPPRAHRLPFYSRYTYFYHLRAELLNNLFLGVFGLYEAVARKALHASPFQIALLTTLSAGTNLTAVFWSAVMRGRDKAPFFLLAALLGRGLLLSVFVIDDPSVFVLLCFFLFLSDPIFTPAQNSLLQANYPDGLRGRLFGEIAAYSKVLFLLTSIAAGYFFDRYPELWRPAFALSAMVGLLGYRLYARTRIRSLPPAGRDAQGAAPGGAAPSTRVRRNPARLVLHSYREFFRVLKENPVFDAYERNYFVYGLAFMMLQPTNVLLLVDRFHLDYAHFSLARQVLFMGTVAVFSPLGGRILERYQTIRASGLFFTILALYPLSAYLACVFEQVWLVYLSFALFGMAMAGVAASWSLGAIYFARRRDSSEFMGVHVTCVGLRGLVGPYLGYALAQVLDLQFVYLVAGALFLTAGALMFRLAREEDGRTARAAAAATPASPVGQIVANTSASPPV
ncbi:MAG: MFS transporter [Planctomycetes bacterium]|nr:MFS transporter [Planctomycetota bacterium]